MEILNITSTRKSPWTLADIGLSDGDLVTVDALADEISRTYDTIPVSWVQKYADENSSAIKETLTHMINEWRKER